MPGVAPLIKQHIPEARVIFILRNPIDRAYSGHAKYFAEGVESLNFQQAVEEELTGQRDSILSATNYYVRAGFYARHLTAYFRVFDRRQLKICFFEDLDVSTTAFMRELFEFIGVQPDQVVDTSVRFNSVGAVWADRVLRNSGLKRFSTALRECLPVRLYYLLQRGFSRSFTRLGDHPGMSTDMRRQLSGVYADDIQALQELTGRNLSHWLSQ
jgi:hypothetical protein